MTVPLYEIKSGELYVRDIDSEAAREQDIAASVASNEYFSTLATIIDQVSDKPEMQQIVRDLLYLQEHYKIVKK